MLTEEQEDAGAVRRRQGVGEVIGVGEGMGVVAGVGEGMAWSSGLEKAWGWSSGLEKAWGWSLGSWTRVSTLQAPPLGPAHPTVS